MAGVFAHGTKLKMMIGETMTPIGNVQDISLPTSQTEQIDVTDQDSPNGRREFIGGLIDSDELTFTINWHPGNTTHEALEDAVGDVKAFEIELNDKGTTSGTTYEFSALVRRFAGRAPVNGQYTAEVALKPSGAVTKTDAA